jgi:predicted aspartyl protease
LPAETNTSVKPQGWAWTDDYAAQKPAPAPTDTVPIIVRDNGVFVTIMLDNRSLEMAVDTGATNGALPLSFGEKLIAEGAANEGPKVDVTMADGKTRTERSVIVNAVKVGSHTARGSHFRPTTPSRCLGSASCRRSASSASTPSMAC